MRPAAGEEPAMFDKARVHAAGINLFLWLGVVFLAGCLVPPAVALWWSLDRQAPLSALAVEFAGWDGGAPGTALVEWSGVRHRSCPGKAYRWLIGQGRVWELPPESVPYAGSMETFAGGTSRWVTHVRVPPDASRHAGPLSYRVAFEWECNPLQRWWPVALTVPDAEIPPPPPTP